MPELSTVVGEVPCSSGGSEVGGVVKPVVVDEPCHGRLGTCFIVGGVPRSTSPAPAATHRRRRRRRDISALPHPLQRPEVSPASYCGRHGHGHCRRFLVDAWGAVRQGRGSDELRWPGYDRHVGHLTRVERAPRRDRHRAVERLTAAGRRRHRQSRTTAVLNCRGDARCGREPSALVPDGNGVGILVGRHLVEITTDRMMNDCGVYCGTWPRPGCQCAGRIPRRRRRRIVTCKCGRRRSGLLNHV